MQLLSTDLRGVVDFVPWEIIFTLTNLFLICVIMRKFLYKPVKKMLEAREREVSESYRLADEANAKAQDLKNEYTEKISNAASEAKEIVNNAVKKAAHRSDEIIAETKAKSDAMLEKAEKQIEHEKKNAVNEMKDQITEIALITATKIIERDLNDADHEQFINNFIENSGEIKWQS